MPDEVSTTTTDTVKKTSDGMVKVSLEKYEEMVESIARKDGTISDLRGQLNRLRSEPPIINQTTVNKTPEMVAEEHRVWGGGLMGLGATLFAIGAYRYRKGRG